MINILPELKGSPLIELLKKYLADNPTIASLFVDATELEFQLGYFLKFFEVHNIIIIVGHRATFIYYSHDPTDSKILIPYYATSGYPYTIQEVLNGELPIMSRYHAAILYLFKAHNNIPY
jgi:hypothetical protein